MAYDEGVLRAHDGTAPEKTEPLPREQSRYQGEGFRVEPDFRTDDGAPYMGSQPISGAPSARAGDTTVGVGQRVATPNLEYVFDDPDEGEPGPDRMLVHGLWELILALLVAGLGYLLYRQSPSMFGGDSLQRLLLDASALGALAMGSAVA